LQTFLPYPCFTRSAACLDYRRLGKQRVECLQIFRANSLTDPTVGWRNHPATLMWRGFDQALASYALAICEEWSRRNYVSNITSFFLDFLATCPDWTDTCDPPWLGDERLHASHRASLLTKDPAHYSRFGWTETPIIDYYWPSKELAA